jgi:glycosyltransferase involved in cell wall biosynthesis
MELVVRSQTRASRALDEGADLYHGMAYMGIPVALSLATRHEGSRVVYDARDIYVDAGNLARLPGPVRRVVGAVERRWARRADRVVTVNGPYAEVMARRWGLPMPVIVLNCSFRYQPALPRPHRFHDALGLPPDRRVVLYHGGFSPDRGIEQLIEAIPLVPNATLVLMGYGVLQGWIDRTIAGPGLAGIVRVLEAVPPTELLDWVASADVVAMPIQPTTLNHRLTTPNKLLEAMASGSPVVASDLPGMSGIVAAAECGVLCDPRDPGAVAAALRAVLDAPDGGRAMGERGLAAAHAEFNWETQMDRLLDLYTDLTGRPW